MLEKLIRTDQPISTGAMATYPYSKMMEKQYRFTSRFDEEVLLHELDGLGHIKIPRALCPLGKIDYRASGADAYFPKAPTPRPEQVEVFNETFAFLDAGQSGIVCAYTGWGKSPHPDEPILMYDGSIRKARDVHVGAQLMGPDSKPRTVTNVNFGHGPMVRIVPVKGEPFQCNDVHILSLRCTSDNPYGAKDQLVNVTVKDWLTWPESKKHVFKLWRIGVDFPEAAQRVDPYFMGVLLGDGGLKHSINVTTMDPEIVAEVHKQAEHYGCSVRVDNANTGRASTYFLTQKRGNGNTCGLRAELQQLGLTIEKHVPKKYKVAARAQRLELLAGLLDTDGYLHSGVFEISAKSSRMADDIVFVARSLGFGVSRGVKVVKGIPYSRITIYGDTHLIPTRLPRKKAAVRRQVKNVLRTGFKVELLPDGEYRGIALGGDHLYLLGDFTVTHNTVLGYAAAHRVQKKTLVITTKDDIYQQWLAGAQTILGLDPSEIGEIRQDKCEVIGTKFVVAMIHSLSKDGKYPEWIVNDFGLVIFDECNPAGTLVDGVPIEQLREGDEVKSLGGQGLVKKKIKRVTKKYGDNFVKLVSGSRSLVGTEYHPVFVQDVGFIPQGLLEIGDVVCAMFEPCYSDTAEKMEAREGGGCDLLSEVSKRPVFEENEGRQPDISTGCAAEDKCSSSGESAAFYKGWQRKGFDEATGVTVSCFVELKSSPGVQSGVRRRGLEQGLAEILQRGHCHSKQEARFRARRAFAQYFEGAGFRCPEGQGLVFSRVDSVEVQERERAVELGWCGADGAVYELEVEDTHTFFANGILVHNCHRVAADHFQVVAGMFPAKLRLGLSATVERMDGKEQLIYAHIGPVRAKTQAQLMIPKVLRFHTEWQCPRVMVLNKETGLKEIRRIPHSPSKTSHLEKHMAVDEGRNKLIAELALSAFDKGRKTVIFSTLHDHLRAIAKALHAVGISAKDIGYYVGANTKQEQLAREKAKTKAIMLTTFIMMGEGTDIPWLDTLIFAMPRSNIEQALGRIRRQYPDKKQPVAMDLMDADSPLFANYAAARRNTYRRIGAEVIEY